MRLIRPFPGRIVFLPGTRLRLPAAGLYLDVNPYWQRLSDGNDVEIVSDDAGTPPDSGSGGGSGGGGTPPDSGSGGGSGSGGTSTPGTGAAGRDGADGASLLYGFGPPPAGLGKARDSYIDQTPGGAYSLWRKPAGLWITEPGGGLRGPEGRDGRDGPPGPAGPAGPGLPPPAPDITVTTLPADALTNWTLPGGTEVSVTLDVLRGLLAGSTAPAATLTGIAFAAIANVRANSPVGTLLGTLSATATGVAPANLVFARTANNAVRVVGNRVEIAVAGTLPGDLTFSVGASADNAASITRTFTATLAAEAAPVPPAAPAGTTFASFRVMAVEAMPAGSPVTWAQPFAPDDIPAGSSVALATSGGTAVLVQQDQEVTWPVASVAGAGSLRLAALSFLTPAAMAAGEIATFNLSRSANGPNRAGHTTLAAIASASDIHIALRGLDLGTDVLDMNFSDVVRNFPQHDPVTGWGTNPAGGYELVRAGPLCVEGLAWRSVRRESDGAQHKWLKAQMYVRQWRDGQREITPVLVEPNANGPHPGGTIGSPGRVACLADLYDGTARLHTFGGSNAPAAFDLPIALFKIGASDSYIELNEGANTHWAMGTALSFSGDLPSGLSPTTTYFSYDWGDGKGVALTTSRAHAVFGDRSTQVAFGSVPASGTVRISPAVQVYENTACVLMLDNAHPLWTGGSGRPSYRVAHDEVYLTRKTKAVPPYNLSLARPASNDVIRPYHVGSMQHWMKDLVGTGDGPQDDRIGYFSVSTTNLLLTPFDGPRDRLTRTLALQWAGFALHAHDYRSGRPMVANHGPDRNGGRYPALGPSERSFVQPTRSIDYARDSINHAGLSNCYYAMLEGSHLPDYTTVAYLRTGHHIYAETGLATALAVNAGEPNRTRTLGPRTYYSTVLRSGRAQGWHLRALGMAECLTPDAHPSRAPLKDYLDDYAEFRRDFLPTAPGRFVGAIWDYRGERGSIWMQAIEATCMGMEVWRGTRPAWRPVYENVAKFMVDGLADDGPVANGGWFVAIGESIDWYTNANPDNFKTSLLDLFTTNRFGAPPFPADGLADDGNLYSVPNSYPNLVEAAQSMMATCNAAGLATIPRAAQVRQQQKDRRARANRCVTPAVYDGKMAMTWDIVPVAPA